MGLAAGGLRRNTFSSLGVMAVVATMAFGLPALDRAVRADRPVSHGVPYHVGGGITVVPPPGAVLDVTGTRPRSDRGTALFRLGAVRYALVVTPYSGDPTTAVARLRTKLCGTGRCQTTEAAGLWSGVIEGPDLAGRYAAVVLDGRLVEATVLGPPPALDERLPAVSASLSSLRSSR